MLSKLTLRAKLYLLFAIVLLPLFLTLGYVLNQHHNRSNAVMEKFLRYVAAVDSERQYGNFIDAVTDAVDSQKLGKPGLIALKKSSDSLAGSGIPSDDAKQLLTRLNGMQQSLSADSSLQNLAKHREDITQAKLQVAKIAEEYETAIASAVSREFEQAKQAIFAAGVLSALMVVVVILFARGLIKSIHRPLESAVAMADRIAKGNLNNPPAPESDTEVGRLLQALNGMNRRLRELIGEILGTSHQVSSASRDILNNNATLSQRAEAEAATLEQTSASLEELTATVGQNADRTLAAQALAQEAVAHVEASSQVVRNVVTTMDDIQASSRRVEDIVAVIDAIAFQTNILALNAAVEAAHAGKHGAGFAVVAVEVRNLAQRCATAAKDIKSLIGNSVEKIGVGSELADKAGKAMDSTVASIHKVSELLREIAAASTEQNDGIAQINQAMLLLDQATQQSGTVVDEAAGIANSLANHAQTLNGLVRQFDVGARTELTREAKLPEGPSKPPPVRSPALALQRSPGKLKQNDGADWQEF